MHATSPICRRLSLGLALATALASYACAQETKSTAGYEERADGPGFVSPGAPRRSSLRVPPQRALGRCWPADDCTVPSKPCYLELTQESYSATLVGDSSDPVVPKAALRVRLCTSNANALDSALCEDFSAEQDLDIQIVNGQAAAMEDQIVLWQSLDTGVGTVDTGPYTEVGAHNVFGAVCQYGDFACRFAWQYCEVSVPDPGETLAAPQ